MQEKYQDWTAAADVSNRLLAAGEHAFEEQLAVQRDALMAALDEAGRFADTGIEGSFRRCEKAVKQVQHNFEIIARVLKVNSFLLSSGR